MSVSVIVSNFNGAQFLPKLIATLESQVGVDMEIIIVDRESTDGSAEILSLHSNLKILSEPPSSGLVSGYSVGAREATHENLFFCNEDMWFEPDCLQHLEQAIDMEQGIAASDPWQWTYDGEKWIHGGVRFCPSGWDVNSPYPFRTVLNTVDLPSGTTIPYACAGACLINRKVYEEIGGWDTSFFLDDEDTDLFLRAWQQNWKCVTIPDAKVYHAVGASHANTVKKEPVKTRRYVSTYSNKSIIAFKYFDFPSVLLGILGWGLRFGNNIVKRRFRCVWLDIRVLWELLGRTPSALSFRSKNRVHNKNRSGQEFFLNPLFNQ